jgi:hypothetical protein
LKNFRKYLFEKMPGFKDIALVSRDYLDIFGYHIVSIPNTCAQLCHVAHFYVRNQSITNRSSRPEGRMLLSNIFSSPVFSGVAWVFDWPLPAA